MYTTAYPNNFDYSDDSSFSFSSQQLIFRSFEDPWTVGDFDLPSNDTLPSGEGLDAFDFAAHTEDCLSELSDTLTDDEAVVSTPPQSPVPYEEMQQEGTSCVKSEFELGALQSYQQHSMYLQLQQLQYQALLQQKLFSGTVQLPPCPVLVSSLPSTPYSCPKPVAKASPKNPLPGYSYFTSKMYNEPLGSMQQYGFSPDTTVSTSTFTSLDTSHFGVNPSSAKFKSIPIDISGNLTDAQYNKIYKKYHLYLQLDSHPTMSEQDLEDIKVHGKMYFLKNVKTIVPKIGPWKFNAHISHRRSDERQYNIPGMAITCKVKEWLSDDGLWRLYHYKKGKTVANKGKK